MFQEGGTYADNRSGVDKVFRCCSLTCRASRRPGSKYNLSSYPNREKILLTSLQHKAKRIAYVSLTLTATVAAHFRCCFGSCLVCRYPTLEHPGCALIPLLFWSSPGGYHPACHCHQFA